MNRIARFSIQAVRSALLDAYVDAAKEHAASQCNGRTQSIDAGALHPSFSKRRHIVVLHLRLNLDDSGSRTKTTAFVMAGWVSTEKKWRHFEREWQQALDDAHIDIFHATD